MPKMPDITPSLPSFPEYDMSFSFDGYSKLGDFQMYYADSFKDVSMPSFDIDI